MNMELIKNIDVAGHFKVGDILYGETCMYRTTPYWYEVIKTTKKQLTLKRLDVSYPTKYMSNTPGDHCMPVLRKNGNYVLFKGYPYWIGHKEYKPVTASVQKYRWESKDGWKAEAVIRGDRYAPLLQKWDGKPGWVNCD